MIFTALLVASAAHEIWLRYQIEQKHPPLGQFIEVDTAKLHYLHRPAKKSGGKSANKSERNSPIVLIHGASGTANDMALAFFDSLPDDLDVYAFDRPGMGWSENKVPVEQMQSPSQQAAAIHQAVEKLGLHKSVKPLIVGHSWGGSLAIAYAQSFPDDVSGMVGLAGVYFPWKGKDSWQNKLAVTPVVNHIFLHLALVKLGNVQIPAGINYNFIPEAPVADYREKIAVDLILRPTPFINNAHYNVNLRKNLAQMEKTYDALTMPILLAAGDMDHTVSTKHQSLRLSKLLRAAHFIHIENAGHGMPHTQNDILVEAITTLARGGTLPAGEKLIRKN